MSKDSIRTIAPSLEIIDGFFDFEGIRFSPKALIYRDVFEGDTKRIEFTLQNISSLPVLVKINPPHSCAFRLSSKSVKTCLVSPGLKITKALTFCNLRHAYNRSMLEIYVNNLFVEYPIFIQTASAVLIVDVPELDFGTVDVGSSAMTRNLVLYNEGAVGTKFAIDLGTNELDLTITPIKGNVRAHSETKIKIEVVGIYEGEYFKEFWIKSSCRPIRIPIRVVVNVPHLIVFHPNTTGDFTLIDFEPTYCGSQSHESMVVRNVSAQTSTFVVLAEINNEVHPLQDVAELFPDFGMFTIAPSAGRMEPYEGRIFTLNFNPKFKTPKQGWKHTMKEELHRDFLVFVRILRVQCMDISEIEKSIERYKEMYDTNMYISASGMMSNFTKVQDEEPPLTATSNNSDASSMKNMDLAGPVVRFCLHGEAIKASLQMQPTAIDFGDVEVGLVETRVIRLTNCSAILSIHYRYVKEHCFEVIPPEGLLKPSEAVEVIVTATPTRIGLMQKKLSFDLLDPSQSIFHTTSRRPVGSSTFDVQFNAPAIATQRRPKFNMGITPQETLHEVGRQTDQVTFRDPGPTPQGTTVACHVGIRRPWAKPQAPTPPSAPPQTTFTKTATTTRRVSETKFRNQAEPPKVVSTKFDTIHNFHAVSWRKGVQRDIRGTGGAIRVPTLQSSTSEPVVMPTLPKGTWKREPNTQNYTFILDQPVYHPRPDIKRRVTSPNIKECREPIGRKTDALIAFPNYQQQSNRPWPKGQPCKTIFTGTDRYSKPADEVDTYSAKELAAKKLHDQEYTDFCRKTGQQIHSKLALLQKPRGPKENAIYEVTNEHLYNLLRMKPPRSLLHPLPSKESKRLPEELHVPLTPIQLYNIKINPHDINFGKVAPNSNSTEILHMENFNKFDVKVKISPGRSCVKLPKGDTKIVKGCSNTSLPIVYNADTLGRYNGYMEYVINENHSFEVIVTAEVVPKSLLLSTTNIVFSTTNPEEAFHPYFTTVRVSNPLQTFTKFTWEVPENSSFRPKPLTGSVPPLRSIMCEIVKSPNPHGPQSSDLILRAESGIYQVLVCTLTPRKCKVEFVAAKMNVGQIPLNLTTTFKAFLRNGNYEDMMFKVMNPEPMPGCEVFPMSGVIRARSFLPLELRMQIGALVEFQYLVHVIVQRSNKLVLEVKGTVGYPRVVITPDVLHLRRISADSFDCLKLSAQNTGSTNVEIKFNLDEFPEYRLSPSRKKEIPFYGPEGFTLGEGKIQTFYLHFFPVDVATYNFYLPIVVNGILGPPKMDIVETHKPSFYLRNNEKMLQGYGTLLYEMPKKIPTVRIDCTVAGHLLTFSKLHMEFSLLPSSKKKPFDDVTISNEHRNPIEFLVSTVELSSPLCAFTFTHHGGKCAETRQNHSLIVVNLEPGESVVFRAAFTPHTTGTFTTNVPVYVKKYGLGNAFNYIHLTGIYPSPTITCSTSEVFFCPVPLDVEVSKAITLDCRYFPRSADVQATVVATDPISGRSLSNLVRVHFLTGSCISGSESRVTMPVLLTFKSARVVSFRGVVTFRDAGKSQAVVAVVATADNSTVTTHAYITGNFTVPEKERSSLPRRMSKVPTLQASVMSQVTSHVTLPYDSYDSQRKLSSRASKQISISSDDNLLLQYSSKLDSVAQLPQGYRTPDNLVSDSKQVLLGSLVNKDYSQFMGVYPQFPEDDDDSEYARHMRQTLEAAETWVFEQGYRCDFSASIPDGFTAMTDGLVATSSRDTVEKFQMKSVYDLLFNLAGPGITKNLHKPLPADSDLHRVKQAHTMYRQLLQFLRVQGACLAHVRPKHLLSYTDYVTYTKKVRSPTHATPPSMHERASTGSSAQVPEFSISSADSTSIHEILKNAKESVEFANPPHFDVRHKMDPDCTLCVEVLPENKYKALCKQAWLDVILQIFKTLIISKVNFDTVKENFSSFTEIPASELMAPDDASSARYQLGLKDYSQTLYQKQLQKTIHLSTDKHLHNDSELLLLKWLNIHYEKQRTVLSAPQLLPDPNSQPQTNIHGHSHGKKKKKKMNARPMRATTTMSQQRHSMENQCVPPERIVGNFDTDLADGLVLAAVTAAHCPYLVPIYFTDLYLQPESTEEAYHNAALLTNAWHALHLGFTITPTDIVVPNTVLLLMLATSLYNILPCLYPKTTVHFQTGLTSEITRQIQLTNTSSRRIAYSLHIIGDPQGYFSVDTPTSPNCIVAIQSHEKTTISIRFKAKRIGKVHATLVLSGATISPQFAQHLAFTLEGEPIQLTTSETFTLSVPLYTPTTIALPIKPPHAGPAEYEISCTEVEPTNSEDLNASPWRELRQRKVPRRLYIHKNKLTIAPGEDSAPLQLTIACLAPTTRSFWLVFTNQEIGDFIIKIVILPRTTETITTLQAMLPDRWTDAACFCASVWATRELGMEACPCRSVIHIPCRSEMLWHSVKTMFEKTLDAKERAFWSGHIETNIGLRLIKWLLGEVKDSVSNEFSHIFCTSVVYNVQCSSTKNIRVPEKLTIPDIRLKSSIEMPIHVSPTTPFPFHVSLTLTSVDKMEIRNYRVSFLDPSQPHNGTLRCMS